MEEVRRDRERERERDSVRACVRKRKGTLNLCVATVRTTSSTFCLPDVTHMTRPSTSISAYCEVIFFMHVQWVALCKS